MKLGTLKRTCNNFNVNSALKILYYSLMYRIFCNECGAYPC